MLIRQSQVRHFLKPTIPHHAVMAWILFFKVFFIIIVKKAHVGRGCNYKLHNYISPPLTLRSFSLLSGGLGISREDKKSKHQLPRPICSQVETQSLPYRECFASWHLKFTYFFTLFSAGSSRMSHRFTSVSPNSQKADKNNCRSSYRARRAPKCFWSSTAAAGSVKALVFAFGRRVGRLLTTFSQRNESSVALGFRFNPIRSLGRFHIHFRSGTWVRPRPGTPRLGLEAVCWTRPTTPNYINIASDSGCWQLHLPRRPDVTAISCFPPEIRATARAID